MTTVTQAARPTKTTKKDYLRCHQLAKESDRSKRLALLEIYEAELYRHAGYLAWSEYVATEWAYSERHSYRILQAARVQVDLTRASGGMDPAAASDRALAELAKIDVAELRQEIWAEASAAGDTTEEKIRDLVAGYMAEIEEQGQEHELTGAEFAREARGGQPAPRSGPDWADRLIKRFSIAPKFHAKMEAGKEEAQADWERYMATLRRHRR